MVRAYNDPQVRCLSYASLTYAITELGNPGRLRISIAVVVCSKDDEPPTMIEYVWLGCACDCDLFTAIE